MSVVELHHYLEPAKKTWHHWPGIIRAESLGEEVRFFDGDQNWFREVEMEVAVVGIPEARNAPDHTPAGAPAVIRYWLYGLRKVSGRARIADLGDVRGNSLNDRYQATEEVVEYLTGRGIFVIVLGGSQDLTVPVCQWFKKNDNRLNVAIADAFLDIAPEGDDFSAMAFINRLVEDLDDKIDEVAILGAQYYYLSPRQEQYMIDHYFPVYRLKDVRGDQIGGTEVVLRDASVLSFDFTCIEGQYAPGGGLKPYGFSGAEACRLFWYAGAGERMRTIGLFNVPVPHEKGGEGEASQGALMIWHALEGMAARWGDDPWISVEDYQYNVVYLDEYDENLHFFYNPANDRWWLEVPWYSGVKIVACHASDYEIALGKDIPPVWWRYYHKTKDFQGEDHKD